MLAAPVRRFFVLALMLGVGCASDARDGEVTGALSTAIVNGTPDATDPAVVALVTRRVHCQEPLVDSFCTGVLVADRVVLTAAHCALADGQTPLDFEVYVGDHVNGGTGRFYAVVDQHIHPSYDPMTYANDLALLELALSPGVAPVSLASVAPPPMGATVRVVGFGLDQNHHNGDKLEGTSTLASLDSMILRTEPSPALACGGDSGAPVFFDDVGGPRLIGIARSGDAACASYTNATRIDSYIGTFVQPYVDAPPSPSRRPAQLTENLCSAPCTIDDDCPLGMLCLPERALGHLCGYPELRSGMLGATCTTNTDCATASGPGLCAASGAGDDGRSCGCFTTCTDLATQASGDGGANEGDATASPPPSESGGCAIAAVACRGENDVSATMMVLLLPLAWAARARRSRRQTCG
jgi:V8-like Glu-specific endopeptidase